MTDQNDTGNFNKSNHGIFQTPSAKSDSDTPLKKEEAKFVGTIENPLMTFEDQNAGMDPLDIQLL